MPLADIGSCAAAWRWAGSGSYAVAERPVRSMPAAVGGGAAEWRSGGVSGGITSGDTGDGGCARCCAGDETVECQPTPRPTPSAQRVDAAGSGVEESAALERSAPPRTGWMRTWTTARRTSNGRGERDTVVGWILGFGGWVGSIPRLLSPWRGIFSRGQRDGVGVGVGR